MVQHITSAPEQLAFIQSSPPQNYAANRNSLQDGDGVKKSFHLFGKDGFTFWDLLDIINPLQHIPVISSFYRSLTGDQIDPGARVAGGAIFGGPIGGAVSMINAVVEHKTGKDFGEHAIAFFQDDAPAGDSPSPLPEEVATLQNPTPFPAKNIVSSFAAPVTAPSAPEVLLFQAVNRYSAGQYTAGMSAIPVAKDNFAFEHRAAAYMPNPALDLGQLGAKPKAAPLASLQPIQLKPRYSANSETLAQKVVGLQPKSNPTVNKKIAQLEQAMNDARNGWVMESMMRGLVKYKAGKNLSADVTSGQVSVLR